MKTYKVELIRPAGDSAMWVVRGLPETFVFSHDEWMREWFKRIGVSETNDTILHTDNGGDPDVYEAREILAIYGAVYDEINTNPAIKDGDVFEIEAANVPLWHSYEKDAETFPIPAMKLKMEGVHAMPADEETKTLLNAAHKKLN